MSMLSWRIRQKPLRMHPAGHGNNRRSTASLREFLPMKDAIIREHIAGAAFCHTGPLVVLT
jgi:hypothetical protein